jgi:hypothetical protein
MSCIIGLERSYYRCSGPSRAQGCGFRDPGVGPITASLIATKIGHIGLVKSARHLAASAFDVSSGWNPASCTSA